MRDISARELKGHNILAVERFRDNTRWMIEFSVLRTCSYGSPGDEMRLFLTEDGYQAALLSRSAGKSKSSGMPMLWKGISSTSSRKRIATRKPPPTKKGLNYVYR